MRLPRKFLKFDYGVHILFGVLLATCIVLVPFSEGMSIWGLFPLWFLLGAWQVLSALLMTFGYHNKNRLHYLLLVAVYLFVLCLPLPSFLFSEYFIFLSPGFAGWYAYMTYKDATYRTPSFWDLEF